MTFLTLFIALSFLLFFSPTIHPSHGAVHDNNISETLGFRATLTHMDYNKNLSKIELLRLALHRGSKRLKGLSLVASRLCTGNTEFPVLNSLYIGEYILNLSIGTPPISIPLILDTGSSLIWTQCAPCDPCMPQSSPIFNPKKSHSYSILNCSTNQCRGLVPISRPSCAKHPGGKCRFDYTYGDGSGTRGNLATETLWLGKNETRRITFGCGFSNTGEFYNSSGVLGMGRVNLSLVQQFKDKKLSYCLPTFGSNERGLFLLGNQVMTPPGAITIALVNNPKWPDYYYLPLEGIGIGGIPLAINKSTFSINEDGSGGTIIDSGTTFTYLEASTFKLVKETLIDQLKLDLVNETDFGFDLCFNISSQRNFHFPNMELLFEGGAKLELTTNKCFIYADEEVVCLSMGSSSDISVLGTLLQQNTLVVYDLVQQTISFLPKEQCAE